MMAPANCHGDDNLRRCEATTNVKPVHKSFVLIKISILLISGNCTLYFKFLNRYNPQMAFLCAREGHTQETPMNLLLDFNRQHTWTYIVVRRFLFD